MTALMQGSAMEDATNLDAQIGDDTAGDVADPSPLDPGLTSGEYALDLIQRQVRRLGKLQGEVLADHDPEPLHQLRVSLRRLRTALSQFGPALVLPESVTDRRIAAVARRTGLCRDLDVLQLRLQQHLLPSLPGHEQQALEGPMKRLARDRSQAFDTLKEALHSSRYLKLLARLHKWQQRPRFTPLGQRPLAPWLYDWQAPFTAALFLHGGWTVEDPTAEALHDLRKRIKAARYALEHLENWCEPALRAWIQELRQAQEILGELFDPDAYPFLEGRQPGSSSKDEILTNLPAATGRHGRHEFRPDVLAIAPPGPGRHRRHR
jgi:CHAD domain-containing protein